MPDRCQTRMLPTPGRIPLLLFPYCSPNVAYLFRVNCLECFLHNTTKTSEKYKASIDCAKNQKVMAKNTSSTLDHLCLQGYLCIARLPVLEWLRCTYRGILGIPILQKVWFGGVFETHLLQGDAGMSPKSQKNSSGRRRSVSSIFPTR